MSVLKSQYFYENTGQPLFGIGSVSDTEFAHRNDCPCNNAGKSRLGV